VTAVWFEGRWPVVPGMLLRLTGQEGAGTQGDPIVFYVKKGIASWLATVVTSIVLNVVAAAVVALGAWCLLHWVAALR
jgi:hypothetical protein